jgi:RND family efflux transporter MFP subunit
MIVGLQCSCARKKTADSIITAGVERKDYVDVVTVTGILEAASTHNFGCPGIFSDVTIKYLIPEGTYVKTGDTLCIMEARELENYYILELQQLDEVRAEYNKSAADLELQYLLLEAQVKNIEASTEITRLDSTQMQFTSPLSAEIIRLELRKADIEKEVILKKLEFLKRINESELQKMKMKIMQQENQVDRAREQLDKLTLTADVEGIVLYALSWQSGIKIREGDVVWADMPIVNIPDVREMQVKLEVNEADYKRLAINQDLAVRVDAFPDKILAGKIKYKAPVGQPVKRGSEVKVFEVTASLDSPSVALQPGLGVTCEVMVKRIQDTLIVPVIALFEEDSTKVVYVLEDNKFIKKVVKVSEYNSKQAIITEGLRANEVIALMKPPESIILQLPTQ